MFMSEAYLRIGDHNDVCGEQSAICKLILKLPSAVSLHKKRIITELHLLVLVFRQCLFIFIQN
jgi:hypothetical protein